MPCTQHDKNTEVMVLKVGSVMHSQIFNSCLQYVTNLESTLLLVLLLLLEKFNYLCMFLAVPLK